mmetsp:Transcript_15105/g.49539  ORF Transcript_15105/g.49539 Transcript_15105/m.49539 type:complete len:236 (-) Transcript_15105:330-1037(-)
MLIEVVPHPEHLGAEVGAVVLVEARSWGHLHVHLERAVPIRARSLRSDSCAKDGSLALDPRREGRHPNHCAVPNEHAIRIEPFDALGKGDHHGEELEALLAALRDGEGDGGRFAARVHSNVVKSPERNVPRHELAQLAPPKLGGWAHRPVRNAHRVRHEPVVSVRVVPRPERPCVRVGIPWKRVRLLGVLLDHVPCPSRRLVLEHHVRRHPALVSHVQTKAYDPTSDGVHRARHR